MVDVDAIVTDTSACRALRWDVRSCCSVDAVTFSDATARSGSTYVRRPVDSLRLDRRTQGRPSMEIEVKVTATMEVEVDVTVTPVDGRLPGPPGRR
jgi:hypothetical protein